ncbi:MAG: aspartate kinase [Candidatus Bathyarchaeota archaeon]|nr:aspartate kinase [Candidatus Bathyarchaeota archaeon]MDW8023459.1 aspartate kinase [Nitrososphaerota archaeon]MDW8041093.1 aspartate kinase [Nitrososphaerota archaeon]
MEEHQNHVHGSIFVVKFGGSSLANGEKISNAVKAVAKELGKGAKIAVVVSAMGKTTDFLLETIKEAINCEKMACNTDVDDVLAMGERTSARIFSAALKANGVRCRYFDPSDPDWPIITNEVPMNADPILEICEGRICKYVLPLLNEGVVVVVPGFVGKTSDGKITTMGRGGSDITAFVLARALKAKQVILVTDVDGIMTADPKLVKSARKIPQIDINSLIGLASSSYKFLQRKALKYKEDWMDVKIINHAHGDLGVEGTVIKGSLTRNTASVDFSEAIASITIVGKGLSQSPDILHQVVQKLRISEVQLLGFSANYDSMIIYIPENMLDKVLEPLHMVVYDNSEAIAMAVRKNLALIKIKRAELEETPGVIGGLTRALSMKGINIYGLFTVASGIHVFVDRANVEEALAVVRKSLEEN